MTAIVICILLQAVMIYLLVLNYKTIRLEKKIFQKRCKNSEEMYNNSIRKESFYQDESFIIKENGVIYTNYNVFEKDELTVSANTESISMQDMLSLITDNTEKLNVPIFSTKFFFDTEGDYHCNISLHKPCAPELSATLLKATESLQKNGASLTE